MNRPARTSTSTSAARASSWTLIDEAMDRLLTLTGVGPPPADPGAELDRLIVGHVAFALTDRPLLTV